MAFKASDGMQSVTIGITFALFAVWMQRQGRWALFFDAMTGKYVINGSRSASSSSSSVSPSNPPGVSYGGNETGAPVSPPTGVPPNLSQQTNSTAQAPGGSTYLPLGPYPGQGTNAGAPGYGPSGIGTQ